MSTLKQLRETRLIELVETHNIARSIRRIKDAPGYYTDKRWQRALYHAMAIASCSDSELEAIRRAVQLP